MKRETMLWIFVIGLTVLYLRTCQNSSGSGEVKVETKTDTLYVKGKPDTVLLHDTVFKYKNLVSTVIDTIRDTITGKDLHLVETNHEDSLLTAKFTSTTDGTIYDTKLEYKLKVPKFITRVDTMKITDSVTVTVPKESWGVYFGGVLGGNANSFNITPTILFKTPKNIQFSLGYGVVDKTYNFGLYTKIPNPFKK